MSDHQSSASFNPDETERYSRHLLLPGIGLEGQRRLHDASVVVVGAGGLGTPAAMYLASAGVGRIAVVDYDRVDISNLQRQVLYSTEDVGQSKARAAARELRRRNPHVRVDPIEQRLTAANGLEILRPYDIVIDATDTFASHYLVNDACVLLAKPDVAGSVYRFEGQVGVFDARRGPCYRCLYPVAPPSHLRSTCAEAGVLGPLPGVVGTLQAVETIKVILGIGEPLIGAVLLIDLLSGSFTRISARKAPECPACGDRPSLTRLEDLEDSCEPNRPGERMKSITVEQLQKMKEAGADYILLDVRRLDEYEYANLQGRLIPLNELPQRFGELDPSKEIVVHCHTGVRSAHAVALLESRGFLKVYNLTGGIAAWSRRIDPKVPSY